MPTSSSTACTFDISSIPPTVCPRPSWPGVPTVGAPDATLFCSGRVVPIEIKRLGRIPSDDGQLRIDQRARIYDRDGTLIEEVPFLTRPEQLKLIPGTAEALRLLRGAGYRIAVVTNQPVIARGDCTVEQLQHIHDCLEMALRRDGAFIDRIYYCPHHPDKGFKGERPELKIDCECRKPGKGMVRQAVRELNLDLLGSWLIGDRTGDIQTARNCGVRAVLLRTGSGGRDQRYKAVPDFVFDDLLAAARFIANQNPAANES